MDLISVKFLVVGLVALIVLGPDKLPGAMRSAGRMLAEFRRVSAGLREEASGVLERSELAEPIREFRAGTQSLRGMASNWAAPSVFQAGTASSGAMTVPSATIESTTAPSPDAPPSPAGDPALN
jgi:sec-independent protein translocase protein TatB